MPEGGRRCAPPPGPAGGQAIVEFALISGVRLLLLMGTIDFGRLFDTQMAVTNASRVGAEWLLDPRRCGDTDRTQEVIRAEAAPTVTVSQISLPTTCTASSPYTVTVKARFHFATPLMPLALRSTNPYILTGMTQARFRHP